MTPGAQAKDLAVLAADALSAHRLGDSRAMGEMVTRITPLLWRVARAQGLDPQAAEDVVQTAWVRLVESADAIASPQATLSWLLVTTRREAWNVSRKTRHVVATSPDDLPEADPAPAVEDAIVADAGNAVLWRHVRDLSRTCQQLLAVLAQAAKPDYRAISEAFGMPIGSIGPTRGRCLAKLRLSLEADPEWVRS